jgi:hypothetical protein
MQVKKSFESARHSDALGLDTPLVEVVPFSNNVVFHDINESFKIAHLFCRQRFFISYLRNDNRDDDTLFYDDFSAGLAPLIPPMHMDRLMIERIERHDDTQVFVQCWHYKAKKNIPEECFITKLQKSNPKPSGE